jgi:hypothetical protein
MSALTRLIFFVVDILLLNISIAISFSFSASSSTEIFGQDAIYFFVYSNVTWIYLVLVASPYNPTKSWSLSRVLRNQTSFLFIHLLVSLYLIAFFERHLDILQLALLYIAFALSFFLYRIIFYFVRKLYVKEPTYRFFVIIGRNEIALQTRKYYLLNSELGYRFVTYVDETYNEHLLARLEEIIKQHDVHEIFCCLDHTDEISLQSLVKFGLDSLIKVKVIFPKNNRSARFGTESQPGFDMAIVRIDEVFSQVIKRAFDVFFTVSFFILILSWLIPIIAVLIKLDSKGPVFFIQQRNGEGNKPFGCIKFRTMVVNDEADSK